MDVSLKKQSITSANAAFILAAAAFADIVLLPAALAFFSGVFAVEAAVLDIVIDLGMSLLTIAMLGFHWALLPTCVVESIPGLDVAPTWSACVACIVWGRRKQLSPEASNEGPLCKEERRWTAPAAVRTSAAAATISTLLHRQRNRRSPHGTSISVIRKRTPSTWMRSTIQRSSMKRTTTTCRDTFRTTT